MIVVVGYIPTPEGTAAFEQAREMARENKGGMIVLNTGYHGNNNHPHFASPQDLDAIDKELSDFGIAHDIRQAGDARSAAELIVDTAREMDADLIVIGLRRRSPVGKVLGGSTAQAVLLDANCPVLAVKPGQRLVVGG
jgi:nucleotide-binding universal stress UspA family protein